MSPAPADAQNSSAAPIGALPPGRIGMAIFLATDVMGFGGLLLAFAVLKARALGWPDPGVRLDRLLASVLTALLLASGITMSAALAAARAGRSTARRWLVITATLGAAFVAGQLFEFHGLGERHLGLTADHAASLFYVLTGFHGLHVVAGIAVLLGVSRRARPESLEVAALYWQFVDLVWIVIFAAVYWPVAALALAAVAVAVSLRPALGGLGRSRALRAAVVGPIVLAIVLIVVNVLEARAR